MARDAFGHLYTELKLISPAGIRLPLHRACGHAAECWRSAPQAMPPDEDPAAQIARPWIGARYPDLGLLALGENLNGYGGYDALQVCIEGAKAEITTGRRRVRLGNAMEVYAGSLLWHRLGAYVCVVAEAHGLMRPSWELDGFPAPTDVAAAFDFVAYTNHVKCSPYDEQRSEQTPEMWQNCGRHILSRELALIRPRVVLILGVSDNYQTFRHWFVDERSSGAVTSCGVVRTCTAPVAGLYGISLFAVPHPQARGGGKRSIVDDLRRAVAANKDS